ncbi:hypothetical protein SAMN04488571_10343 [Methanoculleus thermophilus]|jgi:hypothetical protein|uniref:Uncharacterized protein n=1 Tax=Methanoculleus thermophilus TaxID=2200 RepID=A0A1G8YIT1_9EURY|nr:hypothetical protein SAMN04488571_10343 [Methanoculleus thermophilus]
MIEHATPGTADEAASCNLKKAVLGRIIEPIPAFI